MDKNIQSEGSMPAEGQISPLKDNAKREDNSEQTPEQIELEPTSIDEFAAQSSNIDSSKTKQAEPASVARREDNVVTPNPKNLERNLSLPLKTVSTAVTNIPSLQVDSSLCRASISSSSESLQILHGAKDTLGVEYQQTKRKFKHSPVKDKSDDSDSLGCNDERSEEAERPRHKKSNLSKMLGRKSPSKNKEFPRKESAAKGSRSPSRSPSSSPSRSPSPHKSKSPKSNKDKPAKKSPSPRDRRRSKSPKDVRRARSPVVEFVEKSIGALFKKKQDSETEALCGALNSDSDPPKPQVKEKEKKALDHWSVGRIPKDFELAFDVNLSDTTCDSQSTRPSLVSMDSNPPAEEAALIEAQTDNAGDPFEE